MRRIAPCGLGVIVPLVAGWPLWAAPPSISITSNPNSPIGFGQAFTLTATFSGSPAATGQLQFIDGSNGNLPVGPVINFSGGLASYSAPTNSGLAVGTHYIGAIYSGDSNYDAVFPVFPNPASCSGVNPCYALVINTSLATTTTTLSTNQSAFAPDASNTIVTATVTPANSGTVAGGTVTFVFDNGATTVTGSANRGQTHACFPCQFDFTLPLNALPSGTHTVYAIFNGDVDNQPSTSNTITLTVTQPAELPDLSPWGITLTALLLLAAGLVMTRRPGFIS